MPTPKYLGGAALQSIPLTAPAFRGLNTQQEFSLLGPEWATEATNAVIDDSGRLASRRGYERYTSTDVSNGARQIGERRATNGSYEIVWMDDEDVFTGTSTVTNRGTHGQDGKGQIINLLGNAYIVRQSETPKVWNGSALSDLTSVSGTVPTGNCGLGAFGRLWICDADRQTIKYSALLDPTLWATADGAGSIDMTSVWPDGMDEVVAIVAFNSMLVVFGRRQIVMWADGQGSALGIDPLNIYVVDTIIGTGCVARDSIQQVQGDLWFLSEQGVMSFRRLVESENNPLANVTRNVENMLRLYVVQEDPADIRSVYSPADRFYLLSLPTAGATFCIDTRGSLEDGSSRVTFWDRGYYALYYNRVAGVICRPDNIFDLARYTGYFDGEDDYTFSYKSGWLDLGPEVARYLKIFKKIRAILLVGSGGNATFSWAFDFSEVGAQANTILAGASSSWGTGLWGVSIFGGGSTLEVLSIPTNRTGQFIRIGVSFPVSGTEFAVQQLDLSAKIGRAV
jgi:hypothetical protein